MKPSAILKTSAVLWAVWGAFHIFVGVFLLSLLFEGKTAEALHGIAGTLDLETLQEADYSVAVVATLKQHAFNLGWFGAVTLVGSVFVWKRSPIAIFVCAMVGGLGDLGYFAFIDLADLALPPGPQMTWISATAIVLSFYVYFTTDRLRSLDVGT